MREIGLQSSVPGGKVLYKKKLFVVTRLHTQYRTRSVMRMYCMKKRSAHRTQHTFTLSDSYSMYKSCLLGFKLSTVKANITVNSTGAYYNTRHVCVIATHDVCHFYPRITGPGEDNWRRWLDTGCTFINYSCRGPFCQSQSLVGSTYITYMTEYQGIGT